MNMEEDRSSRALTRIEQALARIEVAPRSREPQPDEAELSDLRGRHDRLKAAVQDSLEQLERLIEGTQG